MDEQYTKLCQAEAVDDFLSFKGPLLSLDGLARVDFDPDTLLVSPETGIPVGTCRTFLGNTTPPLLVFLVTLDYETPERLLLEQGELGLDVDYRILKSTQAEGTVSVTELAVRRVILRHIPPSHQWDPDKPRSRPLTLRPLQGWKWK